MSVVHLTDGETEGVRILTLDDPARRNALSPVLQAELSRAAQAVAADRAARVLVVTGNGPAFCAGADLPAVFGPLLGMGGPSPDGAAAGTRPPIGDVRATLKATYDSFLWVRRLPIPTIAAVNGPAVGAGMNLALACDLRIAGPAAAFGVTFTKLGIHPGGGCTQFLVDTLGPQRALQVILDGGTITAEEARTAGLVLDVVDDPRAAALEMADRYARLDPRLVGDIKRAVGLAVTGDLDATVEFESWAQAASTSSPALAKAVERFAGSRARS